MEDSAYRTTRAIAPATIERVASRIGGGKDLVSVIHLDAEIFPEIVGARDQSRGRARSRGIWITDQSAIGIRQIDLNGDLDGLIVAAVIEKGLLGAVVTDVVAGELSELREGSEKGNGRDMRAGLGRREKLDVFAQERCIVALAQEIGFADGFVGERSVEGECGRR